VEEVPQEPRAVVEPEPAPLANDEKKAEAEDAPPVKVDDEVASVEPAPAVVEETVEG
jgi:hypothetical protein